MSFSSFNHASGMPLLFLAVIAGFRPEIKRSIRGQNAARIIPIIREAKKSLGLIRRWIMRVATLPQVVHAATINR